MNRRDELLAERAELIAKNEAATSWGAAVGARSERIKEIDRALAAMDAEEKHLFQAEPGYVVKPLEWDERGRADVYFVLKDILHAKQKFFMSRGDTILGWFDDEQQAKAAAQADYEQRIRSAITSTVGTAEPGYVAGFEACVAKVLELKTRWDRAANNDELRSDANRHRHYATAAKLIQQELDALAAIPAPATASAGEEVTVETLAREFRRAMLDNPTDDTFNKRAEARERIADEYAKAFLSTYKITKRSAT